MGINGAVYLDHIQDSSDSSKDHEIAWKVPFMVSPLMNTGSA